MAPGSEAGRNGGKLVEERIEIAAGIGDQAVGGLRLATPLT